LARGREELGAVSSSAGTLGLGVEVTVTVIRSDATTVTVTGLAQDVLAYAGLDEASGKLALVAKAGA
jgi:hypothetical protein